jgi:hypothetical protein
VTHTNLEYEQGDKTMSEGTVNESVQSITIVGALSGGVRTSRRDIVERTVDLNQVRENFGHFLKGLETLLSDKVPVVGSYELDSVEFNAEISANGDFKLLGTGVGLEATSGVTFTMKRKSAQP